MNTKIRIEKRKGLDSLGFRELLEYKDLLRYNILKNIKGKYRQMALGPLWIVLQPLVNTLLFTFVFGNMAGMSEEGTPYVLITLSAMIPWTLFQNSTTFGANSLVAQMGVISKVYFPRMIIPLSDILAWFVDFFVTFVLLLMIMFYYGYFPTIRMLVVPLLLLYVTLITLGISLLAASLTVRFRDVKLLIQYGLRVFMFLTPVAYTAEKLKTSISAHWLLEINPMYWICEGFRWCVVGSGETPFQAGIIPSLILTVFILLLGLYNFRKSERTIVDLL
jgi:lipopolysaccharide transport system permease protein